MTQEREPSGEIVIYQTGDERTRLEWGFADEAVAEQAGQKALEEAAERLPKPKAGRGRRRRRKS